jgi:hypothetical protein
MDVFVRAGESVEVQVPKGTFSVTEASGTHWYGETRLFSDDGEYSKWDQTLQFMLRDRTWIGHRVELWERESGNLRTSRIRPAVF